MNRTTSPADESLPEAELEIDEQWERFARDGCPDWWLMAKYTSGWLTRNIPYVPFRDRLISVSSLATPAAAGTGSAACSHAAPEVELQHAVQQVALQETAAAASPARSAHRNDAAASTPPTPQQAHAADTVSFPSGQAAAPAGSTACCVPIPTAAAHAVPAAPLDSANCGYPLKGLFTCGAPACINSTVADKPIDQHG